jgi:hypothetical protein
LAGATAASENAAAAIPIDSLLIKNTLLLGDGAATALRPTNPNQKADPCSEVPVELRAPTFSNNTSFRSGMLIGNPICHMPSTVPRGGRERFKSKRRFHFGYACNDHGCALSRVPCQACEGSPPQSLGPQAPPVPGWETTLLRQ